MPASGQLSAKAGSRISVRIVFEHWSASFANSVASAVGHSIVGNCTSSIFTLLEHVTVLPAASVTVQITIVNPTGNSAPERLAEWL
ncbi:MAG: hypothetical protein PGMFKBFP_02404 [Anaerolineales bacterium]|nr:hypothetical protein [Anaerolineales bacterium]